MPSAIPSNSTKSNTKHLSAKFRVCLNNFPSLRWKLISTRASSLKFSRQWLSGIPQRVRRREVEAGLDVSPHSDTLHVKAPCTLYSVPCGHHRLLSLRLRRRTEAVTPGAVACLPVARLSSPPNVGIFLIELRNCRSVGAFSGHIYY